MLVASNEFFPCSKSLTHTRTTAFTCGSLKEAGLRIPSANVSLVLWVMQHHTDALGYRVVLLPYMGISWSLLSQVKCVHLHNDMGHITPYNSLLFVHSCSPDRVCTSLFEVSQRLTATLWQLANRSWWAYTYIAESINQSLATDWTVLQSVAIDWLIPLCMCSSRSCRQIP